MWEKIIYFYILSTYSGENSKGMTQFLGEFDCKLDAKGRLSLPSTIRKKVSPEAQEKFVVNRGYENCLHLYPMDEWLKVSAEVNKLNLDVKDNRLYARYFFRGATEIELDAAGRVLLPKTLCEHAGIDKEVVLSAFGSKIEIWSKDKYKEMIANEPDDISDLGEKVMGKINKGGEEGGVS